MPAARAADVVGEGRGVAVALHRAEAAERAAPHAERARAVAGGDIAGLGQRLALAAAAAAARQRHLLAQRIHEQRVVGDVERAEVGIGLAADRVQRVRALLRC